MEINVPSNIPDGILAAPRFQSARTQIPAEIVNAHTNKDEADLIVISCGSKKTDEMESTAKSAYTGKIFKSKKELAEKSTKPWLILSAKYGLIEPDHIIETNYDKSISSHKDSYNLAEIIAPKLKP